VHSGASAKRGDTVRNLTTGQVMQVIGTTNSGRLIVDSGAKWERWSVEVLSDDQ
jgi:hypothetical protein